LVRLEDCRAMNDVVARFDSARQRGESALGALWVELRDELGHDAASVLWLRLWSGLDASET
jgi:hypothetical protein